MLKTLLGIYTDIYACSFYWETASRLLIQISGILSAELKYCRWTVELWYSFLTISHKCRYLTKLPLTDYQTFFVSHFLIWLKKNTQTVFMTTHILNLFYPLCGRGVKGTETRISTKYRCTKKQRLKIRLGVSWPIFSAWRLKHKWPG